MTYSAIVEDRESAGFTASVLGWPSCTATGATKAEALTRLRQVIRDRLSSVEIVPVEVDVPEDGHPLARFAGMFKNDALFDQFVEDMAAYRREVDAETAD
ncbi:MAG TPA: type II toxin-antitoxin system HicB family antitoxin [Thermoanaerobaculia bacterium]|jgi:hypothetical protein